MKKLTEENEELCQTAVFVLVLRVCRDVIRELKLLIREKSSDR